jgi:DNA-binding NarL/FixJ family response regulator
MNSEITVLVAEDHPLYLQGLRDLLKSHSGLCIVGEATDGLEAWRRITELKPRVAVLDIDLPGLNGLEIAKRLRDQKAPTAVLVLTMHKQEEIFSEAIDLGIRGFVLKENSPAELLLGIKTVAAGECHFSASVSGFLLNRNARARSLLERTPGLQDLTQCQRAILKRIAEDRTSKEIADELQLSYRTVENHRANICERLKLHGSHSLLKFAFDNKSHL